MSQTNFYAMLSRMKYINRWGLMRNSAPENLSEHTLEVALLTHALCVLCNSRFGGQVEVGTAVLYALYHDCSEIITGDLPTPIKYQNEQIKTAYKQVEVLADQRLLALLPPDLTEAYRPYFSPCPDPKIKLLVKAADKLSALIKCVQEECSGNREFSTAKESTLAALHAMELPEVEAFLTDCLPAYGLTLDQL